VGRKWGFYIYLIIIYGWAKPIVTTNLVEMIFFL